MNESRIDREIAIRAPAARVFRALTEAGELERWWTTRATSEPRPGGRFRYEWTFAGAPERVSILHAVLYRAPAGHRAW